MEMLSPLQSKLRVLLFGFVLLLTVTLSGLFNVAPQVLAVCPQELDIRPCTCDDEGLQCLRLNDSQLARVFQAQAERKAIRRVWIFQTNLTHLPKRAFGDYIIKELFLDLNQITEVHGDAFGEAASTLRALSLTRNLLESFPFESLKYMRKLRDLGLGHNRLTVLPSDAFAAGPQLESVDLSSNQISLIEPNALSGIREAMVLDLSKNVLKELGPKSLQVNSSSRHLGISLRGNHIEKIAPDAFGEHHPISVDLSRNKLTHLNQTVFLPLLSNSTAIDLDENPLTCWGCEQYRWLVEADSEVTGNIVNFACADGTKLESLTLEMIGCSHNYTDYLA